MFRFPYTPRLLSPASSKNPPILSIRCINFQSLRCVNLQVLVTRGKEVERWVPVSERGRVVLRDAVQVRNRLGGQNLLRPDESFDDLVNDGEVHRARKILHEFGIKGYHELRAAWACERYEEISGVTAPVLQEGKSLGQQNDDQFRLALARELGHDRVDVVAAYIGARP
jgi:hypothetical protein